MPKKSVKNTKNKKAAPKKAVAKKSVVKKTAVKKNTSKKSAPKKISKAASKKYEEAQFLASIKPYALKKNEKYMNAKQKQHFLAILDSWAEQLRIEQRQSCQFIWPDVWRKWIG